MRRSSFVAAIFAAVSPHWAFKFLIDHGHMGWVMLGGVLLCVTGAEAMYADLGHFTRVSIQVASLKDLTMNWISSLRGLSCRLQLYVQVELWHT